MPIIQSKIVAYSNKIISFNQMTSNVRIIYTCEKLRWE